MRFQGLNQVILAIMKGCLVFLVVVATYCSFLTVGASRAYPGILNNDALICYMASIVNSFFHIKPLRELILKMNPSKEDRVQAALQITLGRMQRKLSDIPIGM